MEALADFLKSFPPVIQAIFFAALGLGVAVLVARNWKAGFHEGTEAKSTEKAGSIMAVNTATLADMSPMREIAQQLKEMVPSVRQREEMMRNIADFMKTIAESNLHRDEKTTQIFDLLERWDDRMKERDAIERGREIERRNHGGRG